MDLGPAFLKSVTAEGTPLRRLCAPIRSVCRGWSVTLSMRSAGTCGRRFARCMPGDHYVRDFKGARWALRMNSDDLTDSEAAHLAMLRRTGEEYGVAMR